MTPEQVAALLGYAAATDPRIRRNDPDERRLQVQAWARHLANVDQEAAIAAVDGYYAQPGVDAILPGNIRAVAASGPPRGADAALATTEAGPGDRLAADRTDQPALTAGPEDAARERAEFRAKMRAISDGWAMSKPTGFVSERERHSPRREPTSRISAPFGADTTICHQRGCAVEIKAPPGWDPANPGSPRLFCARHLPTADATETGAA